MKPYKDLAGWAKQVPKEQADIKKKEADAMKKRDDSNSGYRNSGYNNNPKTGK